VVPCSVLRSKSAGPVASNPRDHQASLPELTSVSSTAHANDYLLFTLATPAPAGTQIPIAIAMTPNPVRGLPFQFFGFDTKNHRSGALLTSGP